MTKLSAIIINYNTPDTTIKAIEALRRSRGDIDWEVILIENGSDHQVPTAASRGLVTSTIVNPENLGFARAVNQGARLATGDFLLLINSDVFIDDEAAEILLKALANDEKAAIAAPQLIYPDQKTQASFGRWPSLGRELMRFSMLSKILPGGTVIFRNPFTEDLFRQTAAVDWASGACLLIRTDVWRQLGGFDEEYFFGIEDWDFCYRAKELGIATVFVPSAHATHLHGGSSGGRRSTWSLRLEGRGVERFLGKHYPEKRIMRIVVKWLYESKAAILNIIPNVKLKSQK